jgi:ribosomal protein L12E/L44/L45/RPP1/RPP2
MKHLAAYLLLHLTHPAPTKEDVTDLLATVGIQPDIEKLDKLYKLLEGRDINEVISPPQTSQEV